MGGQRSKVYQCSIDKLSANSVQLLVQDIQRFFVKERVGRNWSQQYMASKLGISQSSVSRLESGQYQSFSLGFLLELAEKLGYEPHIIFLKNEMGNEAAP